MTREEAELSATVKAYVVVKSHDAHRDSYGRITYVRGGTATVAGGGKGGERYVPIEDVRLDKSRNGQFGIVVPIADKSEEKEPWVILNVKDLTGWTGYKWVEADEKWQRYKCPDDAKGKREQFARNGITNGIEALPESKAIERRDKEWERRESEPEKRAEPTRQESSFSDATIAQVASAMSIGRGNALASSMSEYAKLSDERTQVSREFDSDSELRSKLQGEWLEIERRIQVIDRRQQHRKERITTIDIEAAGMLAKIAQVFKS